MPLSVWRKCIFQKPVRPWPDRSDWTLRHCNDNVLCIVTCIGLWMRTVGFGNGKYQTFTSAWRRGYRRGLGISNRASLRETLGEPIREAPDLLRVSQLSFVKRAVHSNNELVSGFTLNTQGNLWRSVDNETRTRIMVLSYMDFKSWIKP